MFVIFPQLFLDCYFSWLKFRSKNDWCWCLSFHALYLFILKWKNFYLMQVNLIISCHDVSRSESVWIKSIDWIQNPFANTVSALVWNEKKKNCLTCNYYYHLRESQQHEYTWPMNLVVSMYVCFQMKTWLTESPHFRHIVVKCYNFYLFFVCLIAEIYNVVLLLLILRSTSGQTWTKVIVIEKWL